MHRNIVLFKHDLMVLQLLLKWLGYIGRHSSAALLRAMLLCLLPGS